MAATAAEGKDIVGSKQRGKTRQETAETPKLKKTKTMADTVKVWINESEREGGNEPESFSKRFRFSTNIYLTSYLQMQSLLLSPSFCSLSLSVFLSLSLSVSEYVCA